jgi:hypothetical protein
MRLKDEGAELKVKGQACFRGETAGEKRAGAALERGPRGESAGGKSCERWLHLEARAGHFGGVFFFRFSALTIAREKG